LIAPVLVAELPHEPPFLDQRPTHEVDRGEGDEYEPLGCHDRVEDQEEHRLEIERMRPNPRKSFMPV